MPGSSWVNLGITFSPSENSSLAWWEKSKCNNRSLGGLAHFAVPFIVTMTPSWVRAGIVGQHQAAACGDGCPSGAPAPVPKAPLPIWLSVHVPGLLPCMWETQKLFLAPGSGPVWPPFVGVNQQMKISILSLPFKDSFTYWKGRLTERSAIHWLIP